MQVVCPASGNPFTSNYICITVAVFFFLNCSIPLHRIPTARQVIRSAGGSEKLAEELKGTPEYLHDYLDVSSLLSLLCQNMVKNNPSMNSVKVVYIFVVLEQ